MRAVIYDRYGPPDMLRLAEVAKPAPKDSEVLVKIHASSINSWDWDLLRGTPFLNRLTGGFLKPKHKILGCDVAGRVEAVGKNVKEFQPGDEVFGDLSGCGFGGFADYVCASKKALTLKSTGMTFQQAAAIPQAGLLALQGLRDKGHLQKGQQVLINGAGGGAGTFAVQIAKYYGAEVTAVDSAGKLDMLRSIGADRVIDYTQEDFTQKNQRFALILDVVTYRSIFDYRRILSPQGTYVMLGGGSWPNVYESILLGPLISMIGSKKMRMLILKPNKDLPSLQELVEAGKVKPVIDRLYPLAEVPEAFRYFGAGLAKGKVVITVT